MRHLAKAIALTLPMAACATAPAEPRVVPKEVKVPVPVSCVPKSLPEAPAYTDTKAALAAAPGMEDRYRLMSGNWFVRDARLTLLEGVVAACRKPPAPPG